MDRDMVVRAFVWFWGCIKAVIEANGELVMSSKALYDKRKFIEKFLQKKQLFIFDNSEVNNIYCMLIGIEKIYKQNKQIAKITDVQYAKVSIDRTIQTCLNTR